jgi:hypothetical protein
MPTAAAPGVSAIPIFSPIFTSSFPISPYFSSTFHKFFSCLSQDRNLFFSNSFPIFHSLFPFISRVPPLFRTFLSQAFTICFLRISRVLSHFTRFPKLLQVIFQDFHEFFSIFNNFTDISQVFFQLFGHQLQQSRVPTAIGKSAGHSDDGAGIRGGTGECSAPTRGAAFEALCSSSIGSLLPCVLVHIQGDSPIACTGSYTSRHFN